MPADHLLISGAVEGPTDEAVLRRLVQDCGGLAGTVYGKNGKGRLLQRIGGYNLAARHHPWVILVDLDRDDDCAPTFVKRHLESPAPHLCFRVAFREVEAWLLADRERFSSFFGIPLSKVPARPEELLDPKRAVVDLARISRRKEVRQDMVPRPESGRTVGPAYTSRIIEYVRNLEKGWRPAVGAESADSLRRCLRCLERLVKSAR